MLDPDAYALGTENVGGGGIGSVDPGAGKPSTGIGLLGNAGMSSGTQGGASGVDQTLAVQPCQQYCASYGTQCAKHLQGLVCQPNCEREVSAAGPVCQAIGIQTLNCLTPYFSAKGGACDPAVTQALTSCGPLLNAFEDCKNGGAVSPNPPTPPPVDVASCPSVGTSGDPSECWASFTCASGTYQTHCLTSPSGLRNCTCIAPGGAQSVTQLMPSANVCFDAVSACR